MTFLLKSLQILILLTIITPASWGRSTVQVADIFSDNMVLQQASKVPIWGWAKPGETILVKASWGSQATAVSSDNGKWLVELETPVAKREEHQLQMIGSDTVINIIGVVLGEVWLASGQSNMEMPVKGWPPNDSLMNSKHEIRQANYPFIRMFTVERNKSFSPMENLSGTWEVCTPKNVPDFSAVGYFFARELYQQLKVPVGIIHASWSGSPAQSWVAADFLEAVPGYEHVKTEIANSTDTTLAYNRWLASMKRIPQDDFITNESFSLVHDDFEGIMNETYNDVSWDTISSTTMDKIYQTEDFNGMVWFRQEFSLASNLRAEGLKLILGVIDDLNSCFINGQLVGRTEHWGNNSEAQVFPIPEGLLKEGKNVIAVRVIDVWGQGGILSVPTIVDEEGTELKRLDDRWKYRSTAILIDEYFYVLNDGFVGRVATPEGILKLNSHTPSVLYNAMIAPLIPFAIKGAIWYQGESNINQSAQYRSLFPAVFNSWRAKWKQGEFPFYYVQLAAFDYGSDKVAELREVQLETLSESNVGMAVTMDIGSLKTIHPPNKQDVGKRLALWAMAQDYGKNIPYSGPIYQTMEFKGSNAVLSFDHVGEGLNSPDEKLSHFEIAGDDLIFYKAKATIEENKVIVYAEEVSDPKIVRFAWDDQAMPNLFNQAGLPASPFRTSKENRTGPEEVYPAPAVIIKYHSEWTESHYRNRIQEFKNDPLLTDDIVFVGNSITEGGRDWGAKLGIQNVKNRGISGDVTDGVLQRMDEIIHFKPKAIFLLIGINDLFNLHDQKEIPSAEYVGNNIMKITDRFNQKIPDTRIYLQTLLPTDKPFINENVVRVNEIIRENEQSGKYTIIDLYSLFSNEEGLLKSELTYDGTHLNDKGYEVWVQKLRSKFPR